MAAQKFERFEDEEAAPPPRLNPFDAASWTSRLVFAWVQARFLPLDASLFRIVARSMEASKSDQDLCVAADHKSWVFAAARSRRHMAVAGRYEHRTAQRVV